jgi:hypothetical protein
VKNLRRVFAGVALLLLVPALFGLVDAMWWFYVDSQLTAIAWEMPRVVIAVCGAAFGMSFAGMASDDRLWS